MKGKSFPRVLFLAVMTSTSFFACASRSDLSQAPSQMRAGVSAARSGLWREALFRFRRASEIDAGSAEAMNNLAVAHEGNGEFEKAREAYARALTLDKANPYIQKNYSRFTEFYGRNRRREKKLGDATPPETTTQPTSGGGTVPPTALSPPVPPPQQPGNPS